MAVADASELLLGRAVLSELPMEEEVDEDGSSWPRSVVDSIGLKPCTLLVVSPSNSSS